jgi:hypothetical protein
LVRDADAVKVVKERIKGTGKGKEKQDSEAVKRKQPEEIGEDDSRAGKKACKT